MSLVVTVAKVKASHVHARVHKGAEGFHTPAGGTDGADDLALPAGLITFREDPVLAVFGNRPNQGGGGGGGV